MFLKIGFKTTAQYFLILLVFCLTTNVNTFAQSVQTNCKEFYGSWYISDEFYRACGLLTVSPSQCANLTSISAYTSESSCKSASIQRYGCTPALNGSVFYAQTGDFNQINYQSNTIPMPEALSCINSIQTNTESTQPFCQNGTKFFQCKCSKTLVGEAGTAGQVISWVTGADTYSCYLKPIVGNNFVSLQPVKANSPLSLIKSIAEVLFYSALIVFIANMLRAGSIYIQSEGAPDELKKGRTIMSNTIGGMIFFLLVSGLINYLTNAFRI